MSNSKILDINFSVPYNDFVKDFEDYLSRAFNKNMKVDCTEQSTKNGKIMYKFFITCSDDSNETIILFEKDSSNGNVKCIPSGFSSLGGTFYKQTNLTDQTTEEDNTFLVTLFFLKNQAMKASGTLAAIVTEGSYDICINEGKELKSKVCLVDTNGNVYGAKEAKVSDLSDRMDLQVHYDIYLGPWLKEKREDDPDFEKVMADSSLSMSDKMYFIGKYLVKLKQNDEIEGNEFRDLFKQSGALDQFAKNNALRMIYKMIN